MYIWRTCGPRNAGTPEQGWRTQIECQHHPKRRPKRRWERHKRLRKRQVATPRMWKHEAIQKNQENKILKAKNTSFRNAKVSKTLRTSVKNHCHAQVPFYTPKNIQKLLQTRRHGSQRSTLEGSQTRKNKFSMRTNKDASTNPHWRAWKC